MPKLQYAAVLVWLVAVSHLACGAAQGGVGVAANSGAVCRPSSCGNIRNISEPFRLRGDPQNCGDPRYELQCEANRTILEIPPMIRLWVKAIWYEDEVIRVIDARAVAGPSFLLSPSVPGTFFYHVVGGHTRFLGTGWSTIKLIDCSPPIESHPPVVEASSCITTTSAAHGTHLYWLEGEWTYQWGSNDLPWDCRLVGTYPSTSKWLTSCSEVRDALMQGFNLTWKDSFFLHAYGPCDGFCHSTDSHSKSSIRCFFCTIWNECIRWWLTLDILSYKHMRIYFLIGIAWLLIIVRTLIGYIALLTFLVYKLRRRLLGMNDDVEMFLAEYRSCMPTRYTYRQIRKMTGNFREKLGQGGFGSVFRGKQLTGRPVAIKILSKSDSVNGQDFINEVATIGRIHHANVVQLVGFCVEGSKKALVYEFMPQGSLDRYIYENKEGSTSTSSSSRTSPPLSWVKTLEVAIGIARGIEYLHRGCSMKILHFDIKPQNVLLDTNFNPKISDFGLAKSYPTEKNTVTVTAVRGTFGYMAPELFYASVGGVSSKSDVYSFGMLLMEMAGRRKNVHPNHAESFSNEGYLPTRIYNQLEQGKDITVGGSNDEEKNIIYKLFMVALWCVQMKPVDRPSMGKVIDMLEGSAQQLQMPAGKPFLCSTDLVNFENLVTAGSDSSEISIVLPSLASAQHANQ